MDVTTKVLPPDYAPLRVAFHGRRDRRRDWRDIDYQPMTDFADDREYREAVTIGNCLQSSPRLVVLGGSGSGKTTLFRWLTGGLALRLADQLDDDFPDRHALPDGDLRPVPISCARLNRSDPITSPEELIRTGLRDALVPPKLIDMWLAEFRDPMSQGSFLVLFDAFDQLSELWRKAILIAFSDPPGRAARVVINCRPGGWHSRSFLTSWQNAFDTCHIHPLSPNGVSTFSTGWFRRKYPNDPAADELVERSRRWADLLVRWKDLAEIVRQPMCLVAGLLAHGRRGDYPRWQKYYEAALESHWAHRSPPYPLSRDEVIPQLGHLARNFVDELHSFTREHALSRLEEFRHTAPSKFPYTRREPGAFLDAMVDCGLLDLRENGGDNRKLTYRLSHPLVVYLGYVGVQHQASSSVEPAKGWLDSCLAAIDALPSKLVTHIGGGQSEDVEVADVWHSLLSLHLSHLDPDEEAEAIRSILGGCQDGFGQNHRRRVILAAHHLRSAAGEVRTAVETVFLSSLVCQVTSIDGSGVIPRTDFQRSLATLNALPEFGAAIRSTLLQRYVSSDKTDFNGASLLAFLLWHDRPIESSQAYEDAASLLQTTSDGDVAVAALRLMSFHFTYTPSASERIFTPVADILSQVTNDLIKLIGSPQPTLAYAAAWALGWIGRVKYPQSQPLAWWKPAPHQRKQLVSLLRAGRCSSYTTYWVFRILGTGRDDTSDPKWFDEWGRVARGEREDLPPREVPNQSSDQEVLEALRAELARPDSAPTDAAIALGRLGFFSDAAVVPLSRLLGQSNETDLAREAVLFLALTGSDLAGPILLEARSQERLANDALLALIGLGHTRSLLNVLDNSNTTTHDKIAASFGVLATRQPDAELLLISRLASPDTSLATSIAYVLARRIGGSISGHLGSLLSPESQPDSADSPETQVRIAIVGLFREVLCGPDARPALPLATVAPSLLARTTEYLATKFKGEPFRDVVESVLAAAANPGESPEIHLALLESAPDDYVRTHGDATVALANNGENWVRVKAIDRLLRIDHPDARTLLENSLRDPSPDMRALLLVFLADRNDPTDDRLILARLKDKDPYVRRQALGAVAKRTGGLAVSLLSSRGDGMPPWLDPTNPITRDHIRRVTSRPEAAGGSSGVQDLLTLLAKRWELSVDAPDE